MSWAVVYYKTRDGHVPGVEFLESCPVGVEAKIEAVLTAVAGAPPPSFSGGGMWEAMPGDMGGYYEVRLSGPRREQFRLFCLLDRDGPETERPAIVVLAGLRKPFMTTFRADEYARICAIRHRLSSTDPRRIAT